MGMSNVLQSFRAGPFLIGFIVACVLVGSVIVGHRLIEFDHGTDTNEELSSENNANLLSEPRIRRISDLEDIEGDFARSVALDELLLNTSTSKELLEMLRQSSQLTNRHQRNETQQAIFQRLTAVDPLQSLKSVNDLPLHRRMDLTRVVAIEWSYHDLPSAIEQFNASDENVRDYAFSSIAERSDISEVKLRGFGARWDSTDNQTNNGPPSSIP